MFGRVVGILPTLLNRSPSGITKTFDTASLGRGTFARLVKGALTSFFHSKKDVAMCPSGQANGLLLSGSRSRYRLEAVQNLEYLKGIFDVAEGGGDLDSGNDVPDLEKGLAGDEDAFFAGFFLAFF